MCKMDNFQNLLRVVLCLTAVFNSAVANYKRVCYYTNWAQYRPDVGKYTPDDIDPKLCTHIIVAFSIVKDNTLVKFEWNDETMFEKIMTYKSSYPELKVLTAVGGWNAASGNFTLMVATKENRTQFTASTLTFLRQHKFDGLDLDWEYPTKRGGQPGDKQKFVLLVQELREAFKSDGFLLTAAVPAGKSNIDSGYDIPAIAPLLDFINLMAYDLHGAWESVTGHNSPLYAQSTATGNNTELNVKWAAEYWVSKGAPKEKLIIGLATYGRSFNLSDTAKTGMGAPASGAGAPGHFTREAGYLSYYEVMTMVDSGQGTVNWDDEQKVPYFVNDILWVGFENKRSITEKVQWIIQGGYGGAMIWTLDLDDFSQMCKSSLIKYPLITAVKDLLESADASEAGQRTDNSSTNLHYGWTTLFVMTLILFI